jgi:hypothetical protein
VVDVNSSLAAVEGNRLFSISAIDEISGGARPFLGP